MNKIVAAYNKEIRVYSLGERIDLFMNELRESRLQNTSDSFPYTNQERRESLKNMLNKFYSLKQ